MIKLIICTRCMFSNCATLVNLTPKKNRQTKHCTRFNSFLLSALKLQIYSYWHKILSPYIMQWKKFRLHQQEYYSFIENVTKRHWDDYSPKKGQQQFLGGRVLDDFFFFYTFLHYMICFVKSTIFIKKLLKVRENNSCFCYFCTMLGSYTRESIKIRNF